MRRANTRRKRASARARARRAIYFLVSLCINCPPSFPPSSAAFLLRDLTCSRKVINYERKKKDYFIRIFLPLAFWGISKVKSRYIYIYTQGGTWYDREESDYVYKNKSEYRYNVFCFPTVESENTDLKKFIKYVNTVRHDLANISISYSLFPPCLNVIICKRHIICNVMWISCHQLFVILFSYFCWTVPVIEKKKKKPKYHLHMEFAMVIPLQINVRENDFSIIQINGQYKK